MLFLKKKRSCSFKADVIMGLERGSYFENNNLQDKII